MKRYVNICNFRFCIRRGRRRVSFRIEVFKDLFFVFRVVESKCGVGRVIALVIRSKSVWVLNLVKFFEGVFG